MKLNIYCFNDILIYLEESLVLDVKPNSNKDDLPPVILQS